VLRVLESLDINSRRLAHRFDPPDVPVVKIDDAWLAWEGGIIPRLARGIFEEGSFKDLPVLGDAWWRRPAVPIPSSWTIAGPATGHPLVLAGRFPPLGLVNLPEEACGTARSPGLPVVGLTMPCRFVEPFSVLRQGGPCRTLFTSSPIHSRGPASGHDEPRALGAGGDPGRRRLPLQLAPTRCRGRRPASIRMPGPNPERGGRLVEPLPA